jgi:hypothetical protein
MGRDEKERLGERRGEERERREWEREGRGENEKSVREKIEGGKRRK